MPDRSDQAALRHQAKALIAAARGGDRNAAAKLAAMLEAERAQRLRETASIGDGRPLQPLAFWLASGERSDPSAQAVRTEPGSPSFQAFAELPPNEARERCEGVGLAAAAMGIAAANPDLRARLLARLGAATAARMEAIPAADGSRPESEVLLACLLRLGRDRAGSALVAALGRRILATSLASLAADSRAALRESSHGDRLTALESLEPLPLQETVVTSLLHQGWRLSI